MDDKAVDEVIKNYWALPKGVERLKYLRTVPNQTLSAVGVKDVAICEEIAAFNVSPEGRAYWDEQNKVSR